MFQSGELVLNTKTRPSFHEMFKILSPLLNVAAVPSISCSKFCWLSKGSMLAFRMKCIHILAIFFVLLNL